MGFYFFKDIFSLAESLTMAITIKAPPINIKKSKDSSNNTNPIKVDHINWKKITGCVMDKGAKDNAIVIK